jgi:hypothetical protein
MKTKTSLFKPPPTYKMCAGPGLAADVEKCPVSGGMHKVPTRGDTASYNGVRSWRCSACFESHRAKVRNQT